MMSATPAHAAVLSAMHEAAFAPAEPWSAAFIATQLGLPGAFGLFDERGGFVLARVAADEAEILTLAVIPEARGAGIGKRLLAAAMKAAAAEGARTMFLEVGPGNEAALRLYASAGFSQAGRRRAYYPDRSDALLMRAKLAGSATDAPVTPCGS
jgi:[ribosomal protein S18]-alanine N-acetyltransferase